MHSPKQNYVFVVAALFSVAVLVTGCGSTGDTEVTPNIAQPAETLDGVYDELSTALDTAYKELGEPAASFDNMAEVQKLAFQRATSDNDDWPSGISYSLSALPDRVAIYVGREEKEKEGDWYPQGLSGDNVSRGGL